MLNFADVKYIIRAIFRNKFYLFLVLVLFAFVFPWPYMNLPYMNSFFSDKKFTLYCSGILIKKNWFDQIIVYAEDVCINKNLNIQYPYSEKDMYKASIIYAKNVEFYISFSKLISLLKKDINISRIIYFVNKVDAKSITIFNVICMDNVYYRWESVAFNKENSFFLTSVVNGVEYNVTGNINSEDILFNCFVEKNQKCIECKIAFDLSYIMAKFNFSVNEFSVNGLFIYDNGHLFFDNLLIKVDKFLIKLYQKSESQDRENIHRESKGKSKFSVLINDFDSTKLIPLLSEFYDMDFVYDYISILKIHCLDADVLLTQDFKIEDINAAYSNLELDMKIDDMNICINNMSGVSTTKSSRNVFSEAKFCGFSLQAGELYIGNFDINNLNKSKLICKTAASFDVCHKIMNKFFQDKDIDNIVEKFDSKDVNLFLDMTLDGSNISIKGNCVDSTFKMDSNLFLLGNLLFAVDLLIDHDTTFVKFSSKCNKLSMSYIFSNTKNCFDLILNLSAIDLLYLNMSFVKYLDKDSQVDVHFRIENNIFSGTIFFDKAKFFIPCLNIKKDFNQDFRIDFGSSNNLINVNFDIFWNINFNNNQKGKNIAKGMIEFDNKFDIKTADIKTVIFDYDKIPFVISDMTINYFADKNANLMINIEKLPLKLVKNIMSIINGDDFPLNKLDYVDNTFLFQYIFIDLNIDKINGKNGCIMNTNIHLLFDNYQQKILEMYGDFSGSIVLYRYKRLFWWQKYLFLKKEKMLEKKKDIHGLVFFSDDKIYFYSQNAGELLSFFEWSNAFLGGYVMISIDTHRNSQVNMKVAPDMSVVSNASTMAFKATHDIESKYEDHLSITIDMCDARLDIINKNIFVKMLSHAISGFSFHTVFEKSVRSTCHVKLSLKKNNVCVVDYFAMKFLDICLTGKGSIDMKSNNIIKWKGEFIPFYSVSAIISYIPLANVVNPDGNGVVGMSYVLRNNISDPLMEFQPFSMFMLRFVKKNISALKRKMKEKKRNHKMRLSLIANIKSKKMRQQHK